MPEADAKSNRTYSGHAHLSRNVERAMKGQAAHFLPFRAAQPPGRRTHATLGSENFRFESNKPFSAADTSPKFPRRPDSDVLSNLIPLFFITQNKAGLWIAREAEGRTGGVFLFRRSALRFAKSWSGATGCATMFLSARLDLDIENRGNRLVALLGGLLKLLTRYVPDYPPPIPMLDRRPRSKWL